jgi:hypothetical protein
MTATVEAPRRRRKVAENPVERVRVLSEVIRTAESTADEYRPIRDAAAIALRLDYGVKPVKVYRCAHVNRNAHARLVRKAKDEARLPEGAIRVVPRQTYLTEEGAWIALIDAADRVQAAKDQAERAREERNALILPMLLGRVRKPDGRIYTDADIADMTGLTSARVAQIKSGSR